MVRIWPWASVVAVPPSHSVAPTVPSMTGAVAAQRRAISMSARAPEASKLRNAKTGAKRRAQSA